MYFQVKINYNHTSNVILVLFLLLLFFTLNGSWKLI
jgi:hypothetical protein